MTKPTLHLVALSTRHSCIMEACFTVWVRRMTLHDSSTDYELHLHTSAVMGNSTFGTPGWLAAQTERVRNIARFLHSASENATVIFTDLDVVPLRPYGELLTTYLPAGRDITWMYNFQKHSPYNSGFMLARNTRHVREFVDVWLAACLHDARSGDQRIANALLYEARMNRNLAWSVNSGIFPRTLVTGGSTWTDEQGPPPANSTDDVSWLTAETVSFHTIGHGSTDSKLLRVEEVLRTMHRLVRAKRQQGQPAAVQDAVWQTACDRTAAEESCRQRTEDR